MNQTLELYLRRRKSLIPECEIVEEHPQKDYSLLSTFLRNSECYNFTFSSNALKYLASLDDNAFVKLSEEMIEIFKTFVGEGEYMTPLYPNFPEQVMALDDAELYYNALTHWTSYGEVIPEFVDETGEFLPIFINTRKLTTIDVGSKEDYCAIFTNLIGGKGILSDSDKEDIVYFVKTEPDIVNYLPDSIPVKENLSAITTLFIDKFGYESDVVKSLSKYYKTATDVLRLATGLTTGDLNSVSLVGNVKFKSFKRSERRFLLTLLENCGDIEEDMDRYATKWIRLGEKLHPGEYKTLVKVNTAFAKIRNNSKGIVTFNSKVQKAYENKDTDKLIALLSSRPGEFARKLATVIRMAPEEGQKIVNAFEKVAPSVATPMLLEIASHFETVSTKSENRRVFFPKGNLAKAYSIENNLETIDEDLASRVVNICRNAFVENMKEKDSIGNVYIDDNIKDFIAPFKNRTASKQLNFVARGTKFHFDDNTKFIVPYVYWKEPKGERTDLDLSLVLFDAEFNRHTFISYFHLKDDRFGCVHSGDEQAAPKGAIECVSVDVEKAKKNNVKYAVVCVNSFTNNPFCDLPECYVGVMEKPEMFSGKAFDPATVKHKSDLVTTAKCSLACILDLEERTMIWADMECLGPEHINKPNNVDTHGEGIIDSLKYLINIHKPTVYDIAILNTKARGTLVDEAYLADTIFSVEKVDTDALLAKRAEIREAEEKAKIMNEAIKIMDSQRDSKEHESLEAIVERLTTELEEEKKANPLPPEKIECVTPFDVDIIVSEYI